MSGRAGAERSAATGVAAVGATFAAVVVFASLVSGPGGGLLAGVAAPGRLDPVTTGVAVLALLAATLPAVVSTRAPLVPWGLSAVAGPTLFLWAAVGSFAPWGVTLAATQLAVAVGWTVRQSISGGGDTSGADLETAPLEVSVPPSSVRPPAAPMDGGVERTQSRRVADGTVTCEGTLFTTLTAGGPPFVAHLVFEPAFAETPEFEAEVVASDGETPEVTVTELRTFGARLEVRPPRSGEAAIEIAWSATGA